MRAVSAEQMRLCEELAGRDHGLSGLVLMENAGRGIVAAMARCFGQLSGRKVMILVGPGNNGGDGLVMARHLLEQGALPQVVSLVALERIRGDAAVNLHRLQDLPVPLRCCLGQEDLAWLEELAAGSDLLVDAIFGTGLTREVSGVFAKVVQSLNRAAVPVVAVDLPSGLDSDSGQPLGSAVRASLTCACALAKPGHFLLPGRKYVGQLEIIDIGIPAAVMDRAGAGLELLDAGTVRPWLPARSAAAHKGTCGHVLLLAGSTGKAGAGLLCGMGALRSGAGLVSMAVPQALNVIFQTVLPEAMTVVLPFSRHFFSDADQEQILAATAGKTALVVGPGLGMAEETGRLLEKIVGETRLPMVVDADGLNLLAPRPALFAGAPAARVLTPHPGEMSRLTGMSTGEIQKNRIGVAAEFAARHGVFLVLKGAATVIAAPDGRLAVNPTGNPGMAAGGMGDVLSGLLAGLLAQGVAPWEAACLAVYVHGLAADRLVAAGRPFGFLAGELAAEIPATFGAVLADNAEK
jgi:NAD(P)H-hydrate epimerase